MESNVNYTIVGAFIITLTAFIVIAIIWLSAGLSFENFNIYRIYMAESVSGLTVNSTVEYNGVDVGTVEKIKINKKNPQLVDVLIKVRNDTPITLGTVAMLTTRSLTGVAYISLKDNGKILTLLEKKPGQEYPVIRTTPSLFFRLDTALSKLATNFEQMSGSIQALLSKENLKSFSSMLNNMDQVSHNMISVTLALQPFIKSSTSSIQLFGTQTLPAATRSLNNLDTVTNNLIGVSSEMKQNPSILIRGKAPSTLGPGEQ